MGKLDGESQRVTWVFRKGPCHPYPTPYPGIPVAWYVPDVHTGLGD